MSSPKSDFILRLRSQERPLLADGAMGTLLHTRGESSERCFDALNIKDPDLVFELHRAYIEAGAQIIYTNTFGATSYKLSEHGLEDQVAAINRAGVEIAQRAIQASLKEVIVGGDVGPLGVRLAPYGRVQAEQARAAFEEQILALVEAGVDLIVIETFSDLYEIREAIAVARSVCDLPIVASMTFTRDDRTLLGDSPTKVALALQEYGADVIGANCSGGPAQLWRILKHMRRVGPDIPFIVKPNAGWPEQVGGRVMYSAGPEYFADYAKAFTEIGVSIVGGCCGTTPEHITNMSAAIESAVFDRTKMVATISSDQVAERDITPEEPTQLAQKLGRNEFVVAVEMSPPRGLAAHKVLAGASLLAEAGADVIDVADSPMARMRMSPWAVCNLIQRNAGIETTLHFPTRGRNLLRVQGDLLAAHALNIRNVFVVMGDPTAIGDYPDAMDDFDLVPSGLIKLIKQGFNTGVDHAGTDIGQPTSFFVACALNLIPSDREREVNVIRRKLQNGADFVLSQPVFQPGKALEFLHFYQQHYGKLEIPILVGILPLYSPRHASFLHNEVPGIVIPEETRARLEAAGDQAPREGVRIAIELAHEIKKWANGIYLMPSFGRYDLAADVIESIKVK